ncbi:hypothetical protein HCH52_02235 [Oscillospiraceae bacterium HV4-5-C5C]|nr:hypothetical protein [Oscillospiraceae bacterium HV4-5-C5C]
MTALTKRGRWVRCLLWAIIYLGSAYALLGSFAQLSQCLAAVSLRYESSPLETGLARDSRVFAYQQGAAQPFWPTFWSEGSVVIQAFSESGSLAPMSGVGDEGLTLPILAYDGNPRLVKPLTLLSGDWPSAQDSSACLISEALAWQLWGSTAVIGQTLLLDTAADQPHQIYVVRAVYQDQTMGGLFSYAGQAYQPGWQVVELEGDAGAFPRSTTESWWQAAGLPEPDRVLNAPGLAAGLRLAASLPLLWTLLLLFIGLWRWGRRHPYLREACLAGSLIGLALLLPGYLDLLPGWLIPTRWSDFDFWSRLKTELNTRADEWLLLRPLGKDLMTKWQLLCLVGAGLMNLLAVSRLWTLLVVWPAVADSRLAVPDDKELQAAGQTELPVAPGSGPTRPGGPDAGCSKGGRKLPEAAAPAAPDDSNWRPPASLPGSVSVPLPDSPVMKLWISPVSDSQGIRQVMIPEQLRQP